MRYALLALLLAGCGSTTTETSVQAPLPSPSPSPSIVGPGVLAPMAASIDALGPTQASLIYSRAALWNDTQPNLTGTVAQAVTASQAMGAATLYQVLLPLPDGGQTVVTTFGASSANQTRDCLTVLANPQKGPRDLPVPTAPSNALRVLSAAAIPPARRDEFKAVRDGLAFPANGQTLSKAIKLADMAKYLDGTFDAKAFGFQAVASDLVGANTPAQIIDALRLDYPGGFAGLNRLALLYYPQLPSFRLLIPYSAAFGGTQTGDYPFTGNGFTASLQFGAIPEWTLPSSGADLAVGSTLTEVDESGQRILRGTWNGRSWTTTGGIVQARVERRDGVEHAAVYRGVPVYVISRSGPVAHVSVTQPIPPGFLNEQSQLGRDEYRGQLPWDELQF